MLQSCIQSKQIYVHPQRKEITTERRRNVLYVTFKGCSTVGDFINSIDIRNCKVHGDDVGIHNGFCEKYKLMYDTIWSEVANAADRENIDSVVFTGHSAGGSIAQIASLFLCEDLQANGMETYCFTFGTPKTGNANFKDAIECSLTDRLLRIETYRDLVCLLPVQPTFIHAGSALIIRDGKVLGTQDAKDTNFDDFFGYYHNDYVKMIGEMKSLGLLNKNKLENMVSAHSCETYTENILTVTKRLTS